jgi:hypothetical protein
MSAGEPCSKGERHRESVGHSNDHVADGIGGTEMVLMVRVFASSVRMCHEVQDSASPRRLFSNPADGWQHSAGNGQERLWQGLTVNVVRRLGTSGTGRRDFRAFGDYPLVTMGLGFGPAGTRRSRSGS